MRLRNSFGRGENLKILIKFRYSIYIKMNKKGILFVTIIIFSIVSSMLG